jgi:hypothetical protein
MLKREHYPESCARTRHLGRFDGLLLPPGLAVLLYGVVAQVSIGDLFVAGLLPTLLLFLMVWLCFWWARRAPPRLRELARPRAGWADLLLPVGVMADWRPRVDRRRTRRLHRAMRRARNADSPHHRRKALVWVV